MSDTNNNGISNAVNTLGNDSVSLIEQIFNKSNIVLILWFLAIYIIASFLIGIFRSTDSTTSFLFRFIDMLVFLFILAFVLFYFFSYSDAAKQASLQSSLNWLRVYLSNVNSIIPVAFFILIFYTIIYIVQIPMGPTNKPVFISLIETVAWGLFMILLIIDIFYYMFNIALVDMVYNLWNKVPDTPPIVFDLSNAPISDVPIFATPKEEVFNISNNLYTYDDAQSICASYGARLAKYDEIEAAYNDGAEWCNYGWSANQMALFPTQKSTWNDLQNTENHKNDCGRPGVNGGYIDNPYIQFGVNCYGKKPDASDAEKKAMDARKKMVFPEDQLEEAKIAYWRENADQFLQVNSFNKNKWSEY
jgi:hypothetical protein